MSTPRVAPLAAGHQAGTVAALAWAAVLLAQGGATLGAAWSSWVPALVLALAAVTPLLALRQALAAGAPRAVAALVVCALLMLTAYLLGATADLGLVATLGDAVPRLLTEPQPLVLRADLLAAPTLLAGLAGAATALRLGSATRFTPVAAAAGLYAAGQLLASGDADPHGLLASALLVTAVGGWVLLDQGTDTRGGRLSRTAPLLVTGVGLVAAATVLPVTHAFEPRTLVEPPVVEVELASPLPRLGAWAANPDAELMTVTGPAVPLRLAVLEEYDGSQWLAATRYRPLGTPAPPTVLPPGGRQREVSVTVRLADLGGNWLPSPGTPRSLTDRAGVVDPATGTVYSPEVAPGLSYAVSAVVDDPDPQRLVEATVPTTGPVQRYLDQPELPFDLATYAELVTEGAATPYARAVALESAVRSGRKLSSKAISGSALWRLQAFLLGEAGEPGGRVGTSEQFATSFAVLARHSGLPTRVVVGFRPGTAQDDGTRVVRGSDALAWPEVYFDELGWVPFSPTPDDDTFAADRPQPGSAPRGPDLPAASRSPAPEPEQQAGSAPRSQARTAWAPWLAGGVGATMLPFVGLLLLRRLRSLRHRRDGAGGAWAEVLDALVLAGRRGPGDESAVELGARIERELGTGSATRLADAAERAVFGPGGAATATIEHTDVRDVRRVLRRSLPWWRRLWWPFDHRVLRRRA